MLGEYSNNFVHDIPDNAKFTVMFVQTLKLIIPFVHLLQNSILFYSILNLMEPTFTAQ